MYIEHLQEGWGFLPWHLGEFVEVWPAQQRQNADWYGGTADAVCQNLDMLMQLAPKHVLILAGDHIYSMDYGPMIEWHAEHGADVTSANGTRKPCREHAIASHWCAVPIERHQTKRRNGYYGRAAPCGPSDDAQTVAVSSQRNHSEL